MEMKVKATTETEEDGHADTQQQRGNEELADQTESEGKHTHNEDQTQ